MAGSDPGALVSSTLASESLREPSGPGSWLVTALVQALRPGGRLASGTALPDPPKSAERQPWASGLAWVPLPASALLLLPQSHVDEGLSRCSTH